MRQSIFLVLTSAIALAGTICKAGSLVEVTELEAKNLLHRGKARLATAEDGAPERNDDKEPFDLGKMNKAQLVEMAAAYGIEDAAKMKVDDLRDALETAITADNSEAE